MWFKCSRDEFFCVKTQLAFACAKLIRQFINFSWKRRIHCVLASSLKSRTNFTQLSPFGPLNNTELSHRTFLFTCFISFARFSNRIDKSRADPKSGISLSHNHFRNANGFASNWKRKRHYYDQPGSNTYTYIDIYMYKSRSCEHKTSGFWYYYTTCRQFR